MALTSTLKWLILSSVFLFVLFVLALVFAVLAWVSAHKHKDTKQVGPGLAGIHQEDDGRYFTSSSVLFVSPSATQHMRLYDPVTGDRKSHDLFPHHRPVGNLRTVYGHGRTVRELVFLENEILDNEYRWFVCTFNLCDLEEPITRLQINTAALPHPTIDWELAGSGRWCAITWDASQNRWLAVLYHDAPVTARWELVAIDPSDGTPTWVAAAPGSGPYFYNGFGGSRSGCFGLEFCGDRLFSVFGGFDKDWTSGGGTGKIEYTFARLVEWDTRDGTYTWHQWNQTPAMTGAPYDFTFGALNGGTGQPLTDSTDPRVLDKTVISYFSGITYDEDNEIIFLLLGRDRKWIGWVHMEDLPINITPTSAFNIHVSTWPTDSLEDIVYLPKLKYRTPYGDFHDSRLHRQERSARAGK